MGNSTTIDYPMQGIHPTIQAYELEFPALLTIQTPVEEVFQPYTGVLKLGQIGSIELVDSRSWGNRLPITNDEDGGYQIVPPSAETLIRLVDCDCFFLSQTPEEVLVGLGAHIISAAAEINLSDDEVRKALNALHASYDTKPQFIGELVNEPRPRPECPAKPDAKVIGTSLASRFVTWVQKLTGT